MYRLWTKTHFDAAHYIKDYEGKCSREHGHRWEVGVLIEGAELHRANMLVDFALVKGALKSLVDSYLDHQQLNEVLSEENVTAEFLVKWIYERLIKDFVYTKLPAQWNLKLIRVCVWESPDCCIEYKGSEHDKSTK